MIDVPDFHMDEIQIDLDREDYFLPEIKVERVNNSLKNFTIYWQQINWPIVLQKLLITFFMIRYNIFLFPVIRKRPTLQTVHENC